MSQHTNDHEQAEKLKEWWSQYGNFTVILVIVLVIVIGGWRFWQSHEKKETSEASVVYQSMLDSSMQGHAADVATKAKDLMQHNSHSVYASMAALFLAKTQVENSQLAQAQKSLQWVRSHQKQGVFHAMATVRLARLMSAQNQGKAALALLSPIPTTYAGSYQLARGDIYASLKQPTQAKQAYEAALKAIPNTQPMYQIVKTKLANLPATQAQGTH